MKLAKKVILAEWKRIKHLPDDEASGDDIRGSPACVPKRHSSGRVITSSSSSSHDSAERECPPTSSDINFENSMLINVSAQLHDLMQMVKDQNNQIQSLKADNAQHRDELQSLKAAATMPSHQPSPRMHPSSSRCSSDGEDWSSHQQAIKGEPPFPIIHLQNPQQHEHQCNPQQANSKKKKKRKRSRSDQSAVDGVFMNKAQLKIYGEHVATHEENAILKKQLLLHDTFDSMK